jgi:hypothetical protein
MEVVILGRPFQTIPNFLRLSTLERENGYWWATELVASGGNYKIRPLWVTEMVGSGGNS